MAKKSNAKTITDEAARPRIRISDTTLRDAHQSLWATRMRIDDILPVVDTIDRAGYYSLECWGGATFDVCLRFLRENPWERLRILKERCKTPLQMLLRGQNILGYRNYPDDVLRRFVELSAANGIDIFRIFDALNDTRNLEQAILAVKDVGAHAQGTISYTFSPVHTVEAYVKLAREMEEMGADSICIKDMAGILSPSAAKELVAALIKNVSLPVQLHAHMTSGMAVASYLAGVESGAGTIDCAVAAMSGCASQPPVETMHAILTDAGYDTGLDMEAISAVNRHFREIKPRRMPKSGSDEFVDVNVLEHHIPGGMISNLRSQLEQQGALDRLDEVLEELPRCRADMGYPPLVTPTSQIVGIQAVLNVISGERYSMLTQETRDYVKGFYGRSPAPVDAELRQKVLNGEKAITCRPADLLEPGLAAAANQIDPALVQAEEDILSYCIFPEVTLGYLKWRALPEGDRPPSPAEEEENNSKPLVAEPQTPQDAQEHDDVTLQYAEIGRTLSDLFNRLGVATGQAVNLPPLAAKPAAKISDKAEKREERVENDFAGETIKAPLNGTFYLNPGPGKPNCAEPGDIRKAGEALCIIEAMKLFNEIKAEKDCKVIRFLVEHGQTVAKDQPIVAVESL